MSVQIQRLVVIGITLWKKAPSRLWKIIQIIAVVRLDARTEREVSCSSPLVLENVQACARKNARWSFVAE